MLHVDKVDSLQSEKVHITADGLEEVQCYKFRLVMHEKRGTYVSYCIIKSDNSGFIDMATDKPIRGTYHDADGMGLFLSLTPTESVPKGHLIRPISTTPSFYTLQLLNSSDEIIDTIDLRKYLMHPSVSRIEVEQDGLYGVLFKPPGPGPFPCIIDVPGAAGTFHENYSAALASEGFVTFTFAFFGHNGHLPEHITDVDIEYFEKPFKFVESLPYCSGKIGMHGLSFGGTTASYLAIKYPRIAAVVALNCSESFVKGVSAMKENGSPMPSTFVNNGLDVFVNGTLRGAPAYLDHYRRVTPETRISWEKVPKETAFRLVASVDDGTMSSVRTALNIQKYLLGAGRNIELDLVPGGHLLYPPYIPHHSVLYSKFIKSYWDIGGECVLHSKSQETVWNKNVEFFKRHLGCPPKLAERNRQSTVTMPSKEIASKL